MHSKQLIAFVIKRLIKILLFDACSGDRCCFSSCSVFLALDLGQTVAFQSEFLLTCARLWWGLCQESVRDR